MHHGGIDRPSIIEEFTADLLEAFCFGWSERRRQDSGGHLLLFAIYRCGERGGRIGPGCADVLEMDECVSDVVGHGECDVSVCMVDVVVPFEGHTKVVFSGPIGLDWVGGGEDFLKVEGIGLVDVLNSKVIDNKGEGDRSGPVGEEAMSETAWVVVRGREDGFELVIGKATRFFEAIDGASDFTIDPTVGINLVGKVVFRNDLRRDNVHVEAHVLKVPEGGIQVHITDIKCHETRARCRDNAVKKEFCSGESSSFSGDITKVNQLVATSGDARAVDFCLFRAFLAHDACVGGFFITGNILSVDEEASVGAFDALGAVRVVADALEEATEFIGTREVPRVFIVRVFDELSVLELFSSGLVKDSMGIMVDLSCRVGSESVCVI